jgi:hypothetical protein
MAPVSPQPQQCCCCWCYHCYNVIIVITTVIVINYIPISTRFDHVKVAVNALQHEFTSQIPQTEDLSNTGQADMPLEEGSIRSTRVSGNMHLVSRWMCETSQTSQAKLTYKRRNAGPFSLLRVTVMRRTSYFV